jgi:flagellum-specific peptidoglycan hydrolase FlgJ
MIKKVFLFLTILFLAACGSNHNVVRTSKGATTSAKTVVRTVKKPITKTPSKPIVKKTTTVKKPVEKKVVPVVSQTETVEVKDANEVVVQNTEVIKSENKVVEEFDSQIEILDATTRVKVTTAMVLSYIEKYKDIAKQDMLQYGIPASITLGQGILESGAGSGPLSIQANNHFGIKCHKEWNGPSVRYNDDEENECFRKYKDPNESYRDHSLFLITRAHYSSLFQLDKADYKGWSKGLKNAGYATDPAYPTKLIALIERYQLQKFDLEVLGKDYTVLNSDTASKRDEVNQSNNSLYSQADSHQVQKGDTLYSISRKYNITIQDLKKKNNISNDTLSVGQNLIIK